LYQFSPDLEDKPDGESVNFNGFFSLTSVEALTGEVVLKLLNSDERALSLIIMPEGFLYKFLP